MLYQTDIVVSITMLYKDIVQKNIKLNYKTQKNIVNCLYNNEI